MRDYEVTRLFHIYQELLALYDPPDAVKWIINKQDRLDEREPCSMLVNTEGFRRVRAVIAQLIHEKKRTWKIKA